MQSESITELAIALAKAQGEFTAIPKGDTNPFFKSKYAGLPDVVRVASPILAKHGLSVSQFITVFEGSDSLLTYLIHESGQFIAHPMRMHLSKLDSQGQGSATTYARRYSYMAVLGLVADEDDDANRASHGTAESHTGTGQAQTRTTSRPAPSVASENDLEDIQVILKAAGQSDDPFLNDLAAKYKQYGKLSERQIGAGVKSALKVLGSTRPVANEEPQNQDGEYQW